MRDDVRGATLVPVWFPWRLTGPICNVALNGAPCGSVIILVFTATRSGSPSVFTGVIKAPFLLNTKGCCSTRCENKCCTDLFKEKKKKVVCVYDDDL